MKPNGFTQEKPKNAICFDIETEPFSLEMLRKRCDDFDPSKLKLGNVKDPEKRKQRIEEARATHFDRFCANAALDPMKSRCLAIGLMSTETGNFECLNEGDERKIIWQFWQLYRRCVARGTLLVGVNIIDFDLPYLVRRSWALDLDVPRSVVRFDGKWSNWSKLFVDLRLAYSLGQKQVSASFDAISKLMDTGGKYDGVTGDQFHVMWRDKNRRERALKYLANDCRQPLIWAARMGIAREISG